MPPKTPLYKLGNHRTAIIIDLRDSGKEMIWCAQKQKMIEGKVLVGILSIQDGKLVLNA